MALAADWARWILSHAANHVGSPRRTNGYIVRPTGQKKWLKVIPRRYVIGSLLLVPRPLLLTVPNLLQIENALAYFCGSSFAS